MLVALQQVSMQGQVPRQVDHHHSDVTSMRSTLVYRTLLRRHYAHLVHAELGKRACMRYYPLKIR